MTAQRVDQEAGAEISLQLLRLRLPRHLGFVYVLRQRENAVDELRFPGAERLLTDGQAVLAARGPRQLVDFNATRRSLLGPAWPSMLVLDVRRVSRALERPVGLWSGTTRGTVVDFDDLCWDAAASLGDAAWSERVRDPEGAHALYEYLWGERSDVPQPAQRRQLWTQMADDFVSHLKVLP